MQSHFARFNTATVCLVCSLLSLRGLRGAGFSKGSWIISFGTTAVCFVGFLAFMWNRSFNVRAFAKNIHSPINIG